MPIAEDVDESFVAHLADIGCAGFSGAEVVAVCTEAAYIAIDCDYAFISRSHLTEAAGAIKPQITRDTLDFYEGLSRKFST